MEEYRNCKSMYTTDGLDITIHGTAIVRIDDKRMTMHYEDLVGRHEEWRGECVDGEYQLAEVMVDSRATGGSAHLKRIGKRLLFGTWAAGGNNGEWNIVLQ